MALVHQILGWVLLSYVISGCATLVGPPVPIAIPDRDSSYPTGKEFISQLNGVNEYQREIRILRELRRGNIPSHLKNFVPIDINHRLKTGRTVKATLWVTPDYLAVGSNSDFIRVPMNPITAQRVADHFACVLPTAKIVDLVYQQAEVKLKPSTFAPGKHMVRTAQFVKHNDLIKTQMEDHSKSALVAGHKKDVVISNKLNKRKKRVAIYGWHRLNGKAIQPLSTIHGNYYSDYSHGVRLVAGMMEIDGNMIPVAEVLQDPVLATIISYEGSLKNTRYPTEGAWTRKRWMP